MRYSATDLAPTVILRQLLPSSSVTRWALTAGYDGVLVDLHGGEMSLDTLCAYLASVPFGESCVYGLVGSLERDTIVRLLEAGARGVTLARVETTEQAAALAGLVRPRTCVVAGAQIETAAGLGNAEAITATPGLDTVRVVPSKLATSLGLPGHGDWEDGPVYAAIERLSSLARAHGLTFGIHAESPRYAARLAERGLIDYVVLGSDVSLLAGAMRDAVTDLGMGDPLRPSTGWRIGMRSVASTGFPDDLAGTSSARA